MTLVLCIIFMVVGLIGIIVCAKKQKSLRNAQLYAALCLAVILVSAGVALVDTFFGDDIETRRYNSNQDQFQLSRLNAIAEYVNKNYDGKKVVILIHEDQIPNSTNSSYVRIDSVKELKGLLKKSVTVVDTVVMKRPAVEAGQEDVPEDLSRSAESFNKAFEECRNLRPDVIIDLSGLPSEGEGRKLKVWRWKGKDDPKLILGLVDDIGSFEPADFLGVLDCVVMSRNDGKFDWQNGTAPDDLKEAFDAVYVLVTKDNIQQLVKDKTISFNN